MKFIVILMLSFIFLYACFQSLNFNDFEESSYNLIYKKNKDNFLYATYILTPFLDRDTLDSSFKILLKNENHRIQISNLDKAGKRQVSLQESELFEFDAIGEMLSSNTMFFSLESTHLLNNPCYFGLIIDGNDNSGYQVMLIGNLFDNYAQEGKVIYATKSYALVTIEKDLIPVLIEKNKKRMNHKNWKRVYE